MATPNSLLTDLSSEDLLEDSSETIDQEIQEQFEDEEVKLRKTLEKRSSAFELELEDDEIVDLSNRIMQDFNDVAPQMDEWRRDRARWLKAWRTVIEPKDFPFEGASNIRTPFTASMIENHKSRFFRLLTGGRYIAEFSTLDGSLKPAELAELNDWFQYELVENVGFFKELADILHYTILDGISMCVPIYKREVRPLVSSREFDLAEDTGLYDQMEAALQEILSSEQFINLQPNGAGIFEAPLEIEGESYTTKIHFRISGNRLIADILRPETVCDSVIIERIIPEDIIVPNTTYDLERIAFFGSRMWISNYELMRGISTGEYRDFEESDLEAIIAGANVRIPEYISQPIQTLSDELEGTNSTDPSAYSIDRRWLEVYRWEGRYSPKIPYGTTFKNAKDIAEEINIIVWVLVKSRRILKICRAEEFTPDGKRSPVKFDFIVQPDRFFPIGAAEWVQHIQTTLDAIVNQRLDCGFLSTVPFGFFTPASGFDQTTFRVAPGMMYAVKDINQISFPKIPWNSQWGFQEENAFRNWGQELAGMGDPATGTFASKRTTATEFAGTMSQIDLRMEFIASGILRSCQELLYRVLWLYQQHVQTGRIYQVTGPGGEKIVKTLSKDWLKTKLKLHLTGNIQLLSSQLQRDISLNMLSVLLNPLMLQMGIVKPETIYQAIQKVTQAFDYRGVPIYHPDTPPMSDAPTTEHKRMQMGEAVQPSPLENFNEHLAAHSIELTNPIDPSLQNDPQYRQLLQQHINATYQIQTSMQMLRTQQAAMATQMKSNMERLGIRPGLEGSQNIEPGTQEEGVAATEAPVEQQGGNGAI